MLRLAFALEQQQVASLRPTFHTQKAWAHASSELRALYLHMRGAKVTQFK